MNPLELPNLAAWYDLALPASTTSNDIRIDGSNRVSLIADKSGNSATNCLCLPGSANNGASSPDAAVLDITGDLDLRADINPTSVTRLEMLVAKRDAAAAANTSYGLFKNLAGNLQFLWSSGAAVTVVTSTVTLASVGLSALSRFQVRVTFDVDNGAAGNAARFWYRSDGSISSNTGWTQLGADVVTAGVASIASTTASVFVGAQYTGSASDNFSGIIYRAQIYNGIGGTLVFDANFATASKLATSFTESSSNAATVTINSSGDLGARISGERDLVQLTAARQPTYSTDKYALFDGSNDFLAAASFSASQPETRYFVCQMVGWTSDDYLYDGRNSSIAFASQTIAQRSSGAGVSPDIIMFAGAFGPTTNTLSLGSNAVVTAVFNGMSSELRINRAVAITGNAGTSASNGVTIAAGSDATRFGNIRMYGMAVFSAAHDTNTQNRIIATLAAKYGIAI